MDKPVLRKRNKMRGEQRGRHVTQTAQEQIRDLLGSKTPRRDLLIEYLHLIQDEFGNIAADHITALAAEMQLATTEIYEVATFYHHFDVIREGQDAPPELTVRVCDSITCEMYGANELVAKLEGIVGDDVRVQRVPCVGRCEQAPIAVVGMNPIHQATEKQVMQEVNANNSKAELPSCIDFASYQESEGYATLKKIVAGDIDNESVISTLEDSNLRGLGGAGFPAGRKWRIVRDQEAPRIMAVNIYECEPGTFKDRYYL